MGGGLLKAEGQRLVAVGIGGEDHIAGQRQPFLQQLVTGEVILPEPAVHRAGVHLQHAAVAGGGHQRRIGGGTVAGGVFVKEPAVPVDFFDEVKMPQNGGLFGGQRRHIGKVRLHGGQTVPVKIIPDAGGQIALPPVDFIVFAGFGAAQIMGAADPVIVSGGVVVAEQIPLDAAQNVQLAGVALLQLGHLRLVQRGAAPGHAVFQIEGGVAVAGKAQRAQPAPPGGHGHFLRGVLAVTQLGVGVYRTQQVFLCHHCILSCLTLWSMTCRFSSSRVISSREMPSSIISTITW